MLFRLASDTEDNDEALGKHIWPFSFLLRLPWRCQCTLVQSAATMVKMLSAVLLFAATWALL